MKIGPKRGPGLPTLLLVLGAIAVVAGVAMLCLPAGVIAGGLLSMLGGIVLIRGGADGHEQ